MIFFYLYINLFKKCTEFKNVKKLTLRQHSGKTDATSFYQEVWTKNLAYKMKHIVLNILTASPDLTFHLPHLSQLQLYPGFAYELERYEY